MKKMATPKVRRRKNIVPRRPKDSSLSRVLTVVGGKQTSFDDAVAIAQGQIKAGKASEWRPTLRGIEVILVDPKYWKECAAEFQQAGYQTV